MTNKTKKTWAVLIAGAALGLLLVGLIWAVGTDVGTSVDNGGDAGTPNSIDTPGDFNLTTTELGTQGSASSASTTVTQGFDLGDLPTPADTTVTLGGNTTYDYTVKNLSNDPDNIKITVLGLSAVATGAVASAWQVEILDSGSSQQAVGNGDTDVIHTFTGVGSNSTLQFKVRITSPGGGSDGDAYTVTTRAQGNNGTGTDDTWDASSSTITANPFGGGFTVRGDQFDDPTTTTISTTVMFAILEVTGTANPGDQLTYTIKYDSDGSAVASNLVIENAVPSDITYSLASVTTNIHAGGVTTEWGTGSLPTPTYGTEPADPTTVIALRWTFDTDVAAHDNSETTDTTSGVDGDIPDVDAGQVQYKVTIN